MQIFRAFLLTVLVLAPSFANAKGPIRACFGVFYRVVSNMLEEPSLQDMRVPLTASHNPEQGLHVLSARNDLSIEIAGERKTIQFLNRSIVGRSITDIEGVTTSEVIANFELKISAKNSQEAWHIFRDLVSRMDEHQPLKGYVNPYSAYLQWPGNSDLVRIASGLFGLFNYSTRTLDLRMPPFGGTDGGGDIAARNQVSALYNAVLYSSDLRAGERPVRGVVSH